jgi:hypothetical protein
MFRKFDALDLEPSTSLDKEVCTMLRAAFNATVVTNYQLTVKQSITTDTVLKVFVGY